MPAKRPAAAAAAPLQAPDGEDCESARQELLWEQFRDRKRSVMERLGAEEPQAHAHAHGGIISYNIVRLCVHLQLP